MTREIKFRAYVKPKGKVLPVYGLEFADIAEWSVTIADCGDLECGLCLDYYERKDVEIMQYTGLKDSKGVEIYEGDILRCYHWTNGFVFYLDGSYHVSSDQVSLDYENHTTYDHLNSDLIVDNNLEVVGNIYNNPEILEWKS